MSTLQMEVLEALRTLDIPEDKAIRAAVALSRRDQDVVSLKSDILVVKWMIGFLSAINGSMIWMLLRIAAKVGALP